MSEEKYVFSAMKDEEQLSLLRRQESFVDPVTVRHLMAIGVADGWKCLEVGAGAGSITQWLSARVGSTGKVVATDINMQFLGRIRALNLEIRRHDILKDDLEKEEYNLVHCRKLLHHLPDAEKAVKRMAEAVGPGGWLLIEEDDYGSVLSADVTDPTATKYVSALRASWDSLRKRGIADYFFGRKVRGLVEQTGFVDFDQEGWTFIFHGGDSYARLNWEA